MLWKSAFYRRKFGGNRRVLPYSFNLVIGGGGGGNSTRFSPCHPWQRRPPPPPVHRGWTWWWPLDAPAARMAEGLFYKRGRRRKKNPGCCRVREHSEFTFQIEMHLAPNFPKRFGVRWITELKLNIQWGSSLSKSVCIFKHLLGGAGGDK